MYPVFVYGKKNSLRQFSKVKIILTYSNVTFYIFIH